MGNGLFLGGFLAFSLQPFYEKLRARRGAAPAALFCAVGSCSLITAAFVSLGYLFVSRGLAMVRTVPSALAEGGVLRGAVARAERWLTPLHVDTAALVDQLTSSAVGFGASAASFTASLVGGTLHAMLSLFFVIEVDGEPRPRAELEVTRARTARRRRTGRPLRRRSSAV